MVTFSRMVLISYLSFLGCSAFVHANSAVGFHLILSSDFPPANLTDYRLAELERATGVSYYLYEMKVPAGKRLQIRLACKDALTKPDAPFQKDYVWSINGPLEGGFKNRFCLKMEKQSNGAFEQLSVYATTDTRKQANGRLIGFATAVPPFPLLKSGASFGWSASDGASGMVWNFEGGTSASPKLLEYQLTVSIEAGDAGAKPGEIICH